MLVMAVAFLYVLNAHTHLSTNIDTPVYSKKISTIYYGSKDLSTDIQNWHDYIGFQLPIQQHKVN
jgi:hypothetical protein